MRNKTGRRTVLRTLREHVAAASFTQRSAPSQLRGMVARGLQMVRSSLLSTPIRRSTRGRSTQSNRPWRRAASSLERPASATAECPGYRTHNARRDHLFPRHRTRCWRRVLSARRLGSRRVRADQVDAFLVCTGPLTRSWHVKHSALLGFYRYALARGYAKDSPLPVAIPKRPQPFVPYIYSREELKRLLEGALTYQKNRGRLEPLVDQTLLLFLYGTGLRVRESLALTQADVDLGAGVVTVRESKFFKSRLVPLGPQLLKALVTYATRRKVTGHPQDGGCSERSYVAFGSLWLSACTSTPAECHIIDSAT
jgi:hypothetical protein